MKCYSFIKRRKPCHLQQWVGLKGIMPSEIERQVLYDLLCVESKKTNSKLLDTEKRQWSLEAEDRGTETWVKVVKMYKLPVTG